MHKLLYRQTSFPVLQNRVYDTPEEAKNCPLGDIEIVEDLETGLIYNASFRSELVVYDSKYNNEQSLSLAFREHLEQVANIIESSLGKENLVEIGCGKGFFLELLLSRGFDLLGFDPTYEGENKRVIKSYFEPRYIKPVNGLILRHVLEHIQHPIDFLNRLKDANSGKGLIYIEVPCLDWICHNRAWFDIFYEHVNYFRLNDLRKMFGTVLSYGHLFGGQYIYIVADMKSLRTPKFDGQRRVSFPKDFERKVLEKCLDEEVVIWGAASKGVIFSLLKSRNNEKVSHVIDINPAKQGRYLPITSLKVSSPEEAVEALNPENIIYVMNSNYISEIKQITGNRFQLIGIDEIDSRKSYSSSIKHRT